MGDSRTNTSSSAYSRGASSSSVWSDSPEAEGSLFAETPSAQLELVEEEEEDVSPEQDTIRVIELHLQGRDELVENRAKQLRFLQAVLSLCFSAQQQRRDTVEPHFSKATLVESIEALHKSYLQSLDTILRGLLTETPTLDKLQHLLEG
ncbi:uncharacterized protein LOC120404164 isoform X2 [Mauremys reevesii]|uniref:uncharacterized protein LOC120404164 isoform X2 n=1 Tax=Mauremys reevesii TaxID=260615 RepID=UPI00193FEA89|nr:uncharacterized protein LOC120404164 isoform X2 [Mauremys reevesii]